jgi:hypothetical protein
VAGVLLLVGGGTTSLDVTAGVPGTVAERDVTKKIANPTATAAATTIPTTMYRTRLRREPGRGGVSTVCGAAIMLPTLARHLPV